MKPPLSPLPFPLAFSVLSPQSSVLSPLRLPFGARIANLMSMFRRTLLLASLTVALARPALALDASGIGLLTYAWPGGSPTRIDDIGRGIGVVFSPDLS